MIDFSIEQLSEADIPALLQLQSDNLVGHVSTETAESQGFVSFQYTPEVMSRMCAAAPQLVAKSGQELVAYALVATRAFCETHPLLKGLTDITDGLTYQNKPLADYNYYIMGQICIKQGFRGIGLFDALYAAHRATLSDTFELCVTEIASANRRSLAAHQRVGFEILYQYESDKSWEIVVWDFKKG